MLFLCQKQQIQKRHLRWMQHRGAISGIGYGWDQIVSGWGIQHLTVLITIPLKDYQICNCAFFSILCDKGEYIKGKIMCSYWVLGPQDQYIHYNMRRLLPTNLWQKRNLQQIQWMQKKKDGKKKEHKVPHSCFPQIIFTLYNQCSTFHDWFLQILMTGICFV